MSAQPTAASMSVRAMNPAAAPSIGYWRPEPELNRRARFCRALPDHWASGVDLAAVRTKEPQLPESHTAEFQILPKSESAGRPAIERSGKLVREERIRTTDFLLPRQAGTARSPDTLMIGRTRQDGPHDRISNLHQSAFVARCSSIELREEIGGTYGLCNRCCCAENADALPLAERPGMFSSCVLISPFGGPQSARLEMVRRAGFRAAITSLRGWGS